MKNLNELMNDEEFGKKLIAAESAEQLEAVFKAEGVEPDPGMSYEELFSFIRRASNGELTEEEKKAFASSASDELGEEELEDVAGGALYIRFGPIIRLISRLLFGRR